MLNLVLLAAMTCESLTGLQLPHATIASSAMVAAAEVPAHCEVKGVIRPTKDSDIKFAVWLPPTGWNGNYLQYGNGGWAGAIPFRQMSDALKRGYAVAGTDDGHKDGGNAAWAVGPKITGGVQGILASLIGCVNLGIVLSGFRPLRGLTPS